VTIDTATRPALEWKEYVFSWGDFGVEGYDITGIFIGAYQKTGDFSLQVDNVRLK
jgi:hypothetical protein